MKPGQELLLESRELAAHLRVGGAALFPTDTLPALACQPASAGQLWDLKGRPSHKPLILMGADAEELFALLGTPLNPQWLALAAAHWPGALTLVLPASGAIAASLNPQVPSLGLRIPACPQALELLEQSGPLATTSANPSGQPACLTADEAAAHFPSIPRLAPLPWPLPSGQASTVLAWQSAGHWELLREGAIKPEGVELRVT